MVAGGTLQLADWAALTAASTSTTLNSVTVNSGATLAINVGGPNDFTLVNVAALLGNIDGVVNNNGLEAGSTLAFDTTNVTAPVTFFGNILNTTGAGGGSIGFAKLGGNTLILSGSGNYTGATTIAGGTLELDNGNAVQDSVVTLNGGALTFARGVGTVAAAGLNGASNVSLNDLANNPVNLVLLQPDIPYSGQFTGSGSLTVNAGTFQLGGGTRPHRPPRLRGAGASLVFSPISCGL